MVAVEDIILLSLASFLGNVGVALTGFGMAIVYLFIWQIAVLAGYDSSFKYAVFIQAIALFSAQPLMLYKAEVRTYASRRMLLYFVPITIIATPLGQITGDRVFTYLVEAIGGFLVTFVAILEMYQKRKLFAAWFRGCFKNSAETNLNELKNSANTNLGELSPTSVTSRSTMIDSDSSGKIGKPFSTLYTLDKTLGEGTFSIVKEGIHKQSGESFAIKIVNKSKLLEEEEARLQDEITLIQELAHPNILHLYDVFYEPEYYFLVTEKMAGGDLLGHLTGASFFNERKGRKICKVVLEAVSYIHSKKIGHRDLKPENLLVDSDKDDVVIKLADFGFAKREVESNSFKTMCGTPAYVAPEILSAVPYGVKADMWSVGVITYIILAGYQPFRGEDKDSLKWSITNGAFEFDEKFWSSVSNEAKAFITALLAIDPAERLSADEARAHSWFSKDLRKTIAVEKDTPVFFMIGSQRSGSNWVRTMLDEREDLAGPHPPHLMRDFTPIIDKFGDLSIDDNFHVLVDHMCTFVERNQVPWSDKHGANIKFSRTLITTTAADSCGRLRKTRATSGHAHLLESGIYLLSIFDAIMNFYTKANGKKIWMCKSMGMSKFHDLLLEFYGEKRLRYIYLVRDPRDVAMSFMKTPVGDCHYHAIATKWAKLQDQALHIVKTCPHLIHQVHYESILQDKKKEMKGINDFIGERRYGGVKRQASVLYMKSAKELIEGAKKGREAQKACDLSYQFKNLRRGSSFAKGQNTKWLHPETGLKEDEIQLLESVVYKVLKMLGYRPHLVGVITKPTVFTETDLKSFDELNKQGIQKMNDDLKKETTGDFERRRIQAETLSFLPTLLEDWTEGDVSSSGSNHGSFGKAFLSEADLEERLGLEPDQVEYLSSGRRVRWATASQRGYYPDEHDKLNQDATKVHFGIANQGSMHWFSVFDGHGPEGHKCSKYATEQIPKLFAAALSSSSNVKMALETSHLKTHQQLVADPSIDESQSGTTATTLLLEDDKCFVSNVGDSTCMLGSLTANGTMMAKYLCTEHTPMRADERERIQKAGGLVMTVDQRDGIIPCGNDWGEVKAPLRIWSPEEGKVPGCGFTRSIGDSIAHSLGVTARPETFEHVLDKKDRVLIIASDGITEFMDEATCIKIAYRFQNPSEAAAALVKESSQHWLDQGDYMDDITAIVLFLDDEDAGEIDLEAGEGVAAVATATATSQEAFDAVPLGLVAQFWTLFAGAASGYLGGLCGIRGPPIILYFLHPPYPVTFTKKSQRATAASITAINVAVRILYYLFVDEEDYFEAGDWGLYVSIVICSVLGVLAGSEIFKYVGGSTAAIRGILAIFLLLCGVSLLLSFFVGI